ncbi:MAG: MFS transporter [Dehalococcoidia bacterium]|nr:MFS transporter [Dehalococcoidia bacterium]
MQETEKPYRGPAFAASLRHRTFRVFYGGLVLSSFGGNFTQIAISWQMYELTGSALHLGLLGLSRAASLIPFLLVGGMLADAVDRRKLLMFTQAGHLVITAGLLVLTASELISPGIFYIAAIVGSVFTALENPARQAIVPNLVPEADLTNAIALNASQRSVSSIAGPPIAGIILGFLGPVANYSVTVFSFAVMIVILALIRPLRAQESRGRRSVSLQSLAQGFAHVRANPILFVMMLLDFCQNFLGAARALLPIYASDILNAGPQGFGLLSGASAVGSITGGVVMGTLGRVRRAGIGVLIGITIFGVCTVLFAYNTSFVLAYVLIFGEGFGDTVSHVLRSTILQLNVPDELRGRVTSLNQVFVNGGGPLGSFRAGGMAALFGPELAVLSGGVIVLMIVAFVATCVPSVRRYTLESDRPVPAGHQT